MVALLEIVPISILCSLLIGILFGILGYLKWPVFSQIINLYILIMRGLPPLTLLLLVFFSGSFGSPIMTAIIVLSVYHGAYVADIIRAGINSIPSGQFDAANSLALTIVQKMTHVILPQVWLSVIPSLVGQYITLIKDTTLVSAIGVMELLNNARQVMQVIYRPITVYVIVAMFFFVICYALELLSKYVTGRIKKRTII
jgi:His/Glu/Gln/Arg/opine family amino acid ABC transporter permease subunit